MELRLNSDKGKQVRATKVTDCVAGQGDPSIQFNSHSQLKFTGKGFPIARWTVACCSAGSKLLWPFRFSLY